MRNNKDASVIYQARGHVGLIYPEKSTGQKVRRSWLSGAFRMLIDACLLEDPTWCAPLAEAVAPGPGECILDCGPGSALRALYFADRFPDTQFVAVEFNRRRIAKAFRQAQAMNLPNYKAMTFEDVRKMPFNAGHFDKVMIVLNLHSLSPEDKVKNLQEIRRITRRGGIVLAADIDQPKATREDAILRIAQLLYGAKAIQSHTSGTWPSFLLEAGFTGMRRLSDYPVWIGRMALVRSRKQ